MNEQRLIELEIRFSHQDDFLQQLNQIVVEQQKTIERLEKEILDIKQHVNSAGSEVSPNRTLRDDKPPHY